MHSIWSCCILATPTSLHTSTNAQQSLFQTCCSLIAKCMSLNMHTWVNNQVRISRSGASAKQQATHKAVKFVQALHDEGREPCRLGLDEARLQHDHNTSFTACHVSWAICATLKLLASYSRLVTIYATNITTNEITMLVIINADKAEYRPAAVCVGQNEQGYKQRQPSHTGIHPATYSVFRLAIALQDGGREPLRLLSYKTLRAK
jgi:hypothetical protein